MQILMDLAPRCGGNCSTAWKLGVWEPLGTSVLAWEVQGNEINECQTLPQVPFTFIPFIRAKSESANGSLPW